MAAAREETVKEEAGLIDFFKFFRLAVRQAALYPEDHPAQRAFLLELKGKIDALLTSKDHIRLGITPRALKLEAGPLLDDPVSQEMAKFFHARRIQALEFIRGVSEEELRILIKSLSRSGRETDLSREIKPPLEEKDIPHVKVQWLDYAPLLRPEGGEEIEDVWAYLLEQALQRRESKEVQLAVLGLTQGLERFPLKDLGSLDRVWPQWPAFFSLLKEKDKRGYKTIASAVVKNVMQEPPLSPSPALEEKFSALFDNFDEETLAASLAEIFRQDPLFDPDKLSWWFRLTKTKKHGLLATFFARQLETKLFSVPASLLRQKLTSFIQGYSTNPYPVPYYQAFLSLLEKLPTEERLKLSREELWKHEIALCLFLAQDEKKPEEVIPQFELLARSLTRMIESRAFFLLKSFHRFLVERADLLSSHEDYPGTLRRLAGFVEELILAEEDFPEKDYFVANLKKSALGVNYYLEKIFGEGRVSPAILQLFFRLFREHIFYFDLNLDEKAKDKVFLEKMITALSDVDSPASFVALKNIFNLGDASLRSQALRAMARISTLDENFLWPHFLKPPLSWQREALLLLRKKPKALEQALGLLFNQRSPLGLNNRRLIEAVNLVEEIGLAEARPYLHLLAGRCFFWNHRLRQAARRALEVLDGG